MSLNFDIFLRRLTVYPTLSVLLTKTRPTKNDILKFLFLHIIGVIAYLKFEKKHNLKNQSPLFISFTSLNYEFVSAILREISVETSYQIVRWVFRRYTQLRQAICTSTLLRDPPPEFPLGSINSSIDHNLSGPSIWTIRF